MNMKRKNLFLLLLPFWAACEMLGDGSASGEDGRLDVSFSEGAYDDTRADIEMPDTNDFILTVTDADGKQVYAGPYGDAPESIMVRPGSYNVRVVSCEFDRPRFSAPQFGDEQCVIVPSEGHVSVKLACSQVNSGIRLKIAPSFLTSYPDAALVLKSEGIGLPYSYRESRIAYFKPGDVSLIMSRGESDEVLMTRWMEPNEILTLKVDVAGTKDEADGGNGISISVDTARVWMEDTYMIGDSGSRGDSPEDPMGISQARSSVGSEGVWVRGYIVAGDLTSSSASFEGPFKSASNLAIGPKKNVTDRNSCISVQLPSGDLRDELNLVSHPEYLGRRLILKGDIVPSYYGLVGIKNVEEYVLE